MKIIPERFLRERCGIKKDVPLYYMSSAFLLSLANELDHSLSDKEKAVEFDINLQHRPFKEMANIIMPDKEGDIPIIVVTRSEWECEVFMLKEGKFINVENQKVGLAMVNSSMLPFAEKSTTLTFVENKYTFTIKKNKPVRRTQNFIYVSDKRYIPSQQEVNKGYRSEESYKAFSVAGHRRFFENSKTNGHDINGEAVTGWTWVAPYKKGLGELICERIRIFTMGSD